MFHRLGVFIDFEGVLGKFSRDTWHVRRGPSKNIPILTEKLDEIAFLFIVEAGTDGGLLGWIVRRKLGIFGVIFWLEA